MTVNRIVSFLPSATELIYALGIQDKLVGVTHDCNYPAEAKNKPKIITSNIESEKLSSREINDRTCKLVQQRKDIFNLNEEELKKAKPDLIIAQNTCEVCAAHNNQIKKALEILQYKPLIYSMDPHNLSEILYSIIELARLAGVDLKGKKLYSDLQKRILKIKAIKCNKKPKVFALEWIEPFFTAGHWIPEMIEIAGGKNLLSKPSEHSRRISLNNVKDIDPEIIILMPCGFNLNRTIQEYKRTLKENAKWNELLAVQKKSVYAVDANSFFSKPSIRTITGIEILLKIIHPEKCLNIQLPDDALRLL